MFTSQRAPRARRQLPRQAGQGWSGWQLRMERSRWAAAAAALPPPPPLLLTAAPAFQRSVRPRACLLFPAAPHRPTQVPAAPASPAAARSRRSRPNASPPRFNASAGRGGVTNIRDQRLVALADHGGVEHSRRGPRGRQPPPGARRSIAARRPLHIVAARTCLNPLHQRLLHAALATNTTAPAAPTPSPGPWHAPPVAG